MPDTRMLRMLELVGAGQHDLGAMRVGEAQQLGRAVDDALGHQMDHALRALLYPALDQKQPRRHDLAAEALEIAGPEHDIGDAGLVLQRDEDGIALSGSLAHQHDACDEVIPPRGLDPAQLDLVRELACRCHEALLCDGMSRTDLIVTADGPRILEVNTIPGLTEQSLLPRAARAHGLTFPALLDRLLELALARGRGRAAA